MWNEHWKCVCCACVIEQFERNLYVFFFLLIFHSTKLEIDNTLNFCLINEPCHYLSAIIIYTGLLSYSINIYKKKMNYCMTNKIMHCMNVSMLIITEDYVTTYIITDVSCIWHVYFLDILYCL